MISSSSENEIKQKDIINFLLIKLNIAKKNSFDRKYNFKKNEKYWLTGGIFDKKTIENMNNFDFNIRILDKQKNKLYYPL